MGGIYRVSDRGWIGHQAAKMMKRSLAIEARQNRGIEEKSKLLLAYQPTIIFVEHDAAFCQNIATKVVQL